MSKCKCSHDNTWHGEYQPVCLYWYQTTGNDGHFCECSQFVDESEPDQISGTDSDDTNFRSEDESNEIPVTDWFRMPIPDASQTPQTPGMGGFINPLAPVEADIAAINQRVDSVDEDLDRVVTILTQLQSQITRMSGAMDDMAKQNDNLRMMVSGLSQKIVKQNGVIEQLHKDMNDDGEPVAELISLA